MTMADPGHWARLNEALDLAQKPLREDFEWLVGEHERLRTKLAGHDEGLDRWCNYQDRLVEALVRLGLRERVLAELERDGWKNVPECAHKPEVERLRIAIDGCGCPAPFDACTHDEPLTHVIRRQEQEYNALRTRYEAACEDASALLAERDELRRETGL